MAKPFFNGKVYNDFVCDLGKKLKQRSLNLRAVLAEFIGMIFFVFTGCATAVSFSSRRPSSFAAGAGADSKNASATINAAENLMVLETDLSSMIQINSSFGIVTALAFGVGIMVMAYCLGHISGAHFNPAVTLSLVLSGSCNVIQGAANIVAQFAGAIVAAAILYGITPRTDPHSDLGANSISAAVSTGGALGGEIVMTALLVLVVHLTVCTKPNDITPMAPLAIGFAVFLAHAVLIPIDGCSINPARSFGPALIAGKWNRFWVFVVGPLVGAVVGVLFWLAVSMQWDGGDVFGGDAELDDMTAKMGQEDAHPAKDMDV